jgi:poly(3-hydroxybutyrate) depolymerase
LGVRRGRRGVISCPDGIEGSWTDSSNLDFFGATLAQLKAELCIDERHVVVTDHSAGA